jgi:hypothetical protein
MVAMFSRFHPPGRQEPFGLAVRLAIGLAGLAACLSWIAAGPQAALAVGVGAGVMGIAVATLAMGLSAMLDAARPGRSTGRQAGAAFVLRHAAVGLILFGAIRAGLPAGWLVVGVTAWPVALLAEGLRRASVAAPSLEST